MYAILDHSMKMEAFNDSIKLIVLKLKIYTDLLVLNCCLKSNICHINITYIEKKDLEHESEEDVSRLPHDADLDRLLDLQGNCEQHLGWENRECYTHVTMSYQ